MARTVKADAIAAPILRSAAEVMKALHTRYPSNAWALLECVANGTGSKADRWADAIAMSLWPSRGLEIHGMEIKVSRSDLLRELKDPKKAEAVAGYCDFWWIVAGSAEIAKPAELPATWGLLVPKATKDAVTLAVAKEAKPLEPKSLDRPFLAAILRRASERFNVQKIEQGLRGDLYAQIHTDLTARYADDRERELAALRSDLAVMRKHLDETKAQLASTASAGFNPQMIGEAMTLLSTLDRWPSAEITIRNALSDLDRGIDRVNLLRESLQQAQRITQVLAGKQSPKSLEEVTGAPCDPGQTVAG